MEKEFKLTVKVDSSVISKYPNYRINFPSVEEFIEFIISNIDRGSLKDFGYTIKIKEL